MSEKKPSKAKIEKVAKELYEKVGVPAGKKSGAFGNDGNPADTWAKATGPYRKIWLAIAKWHLETMIAARGAK